MRFAQYGISHDHAAGKARVIRESDRAELAGVYEPSARVRASDAPPERSLDHELTVQETLLRAIGLA